MTSHVQIYHVLHKNTPVVDDGALSQIVHHKLIPLHVGQNFQSATFNENYLICFATVVIQQTVLTWLEMNLPQIVQDVMKLWFPQILEIENLFDQAFQKFDPWILVPVKLLFQKRKILRETNGELT